MAVRTAKRKGKDVVVDDTGKIHGTHASKKEAKAQVTAMNIAMGHVPGVTPKAKAKKAKAKT